MSQSELAKLLGISAASVSVWKDAGPNRPPSARPESHFRLALQNILQIPADDWMTDDERRIAGIAMPDPPSAPPRNGGSKRRRPRKTKTRPKAAPKAKRAPTTTAAAA